MDLPEKKSHLESGLNQRDRATGGFVEFYTHQKPGKIFYWLTLHRALRRMAGLVFLLVFWVLAGACKRHGVGGFLLCNTTTTSLARKWLAKMTKTRQNENENFQTMTNRGDS